MLTSSRNIQLEFVGPLPTNASVERVDETTELSHQTAPMRDITNYVSTVVSNERSRKKQQLSQFKKVTQARVRNHVHQQKSRAEQTLASWKQMDDRVGANNTLYAHATGKLLEKQIQHSCEHAKCNETLATTNTNHTDAAATNTTNAAEALEQSVYDLDVMYPVIRNMSTPEKLKLQNKALISAQRKLDLEWDREQVHHYQREQLQKEQEANRKRQQLVHHLQNKLDFWEEKAQSTKEAYEARVSKEKQLQQQKQEEEKKQKRKYNQKMQSQRFISALKQQLYSRVREHVAVESIPPLCNCGHATVLDDHYISTCANNCRFYRNPEAYASALINVLESVHAL